RGRRRTPEGPVLMLHTRTTPTARRLALREGLAGLSASGLAGLFPAVDHRALAEADAVLPKGLF
ncbi:hypothetical protein ACFY19_06940, partial [Streptosporangium saharense]|uniref:hypothetical protein n=1 Tax=Streptosporangium saharense TaxID=1706840 RepID=UPI0036A30EFE